MSDYPHSLTTKPLTSWPGRLTPDRDRKRSPFSAGMRQTLDTLTRELWYLQSSGAVLEVAIPPEKFRIDGHPRAGATAEHPGVVLSLPSTNVGPLRYACDSFWTWQDNLRAIALGLEALRKVERYGITRRGEQYQGFKALPPGGGVIVPEQSMTVDEAARLICDLDNATATDATPDELGEPGPLIEDAQLRAAVWRHLVKRHHPDVGGDRATWDRLEQAKRVLDQHAGAST